jgi:hypothetical protein
VPPARTVRRRHRAAAAAVAAGLVLALVVAACGSSGSSPAATASAPASPSAEVATPSSSGGPTSSADAAATPNPSATPWPSNIIEALTNLGIYDGRISKANDDIGTEAGNQDLTGMYHTAADLVVLLGNVQFESDRLKGNPVTMPAWTAYQAALPDMLAGATTLRDSIAKGDAAGVTAGSDQLAKGFESYGDVRTILGPMVDEALLMQRQLVK